ncbi:MAG: HAMP domain-containing histidine kinase [Bacteroidaceae bacterium]|nr:HAMP domain-containing histidine kinase [Bacteroidaceae bacterium]
MSAQFTHSKAEIEAVLVELDSAIAKKSIYQANCQVHADSLQVVVNSCHPDQYVEKCKELFNALFSFDGRNSLQVLDRIRKTDQYAEDANLRAWTELNASYIYGTMGIYHKATEITNKMDTVGLSEEERIQYIRTRRANQEKIAEYMADISIAQNEEPQMMAYYDEIIQLTPPGSERELVKAQKSVYLNHPREALKTLTNVYALSKGKSQAAMSMAIASAYDQLNDRDNYIYYLATTALNNIKSGNTRYEALPYLVYVLFEAGDINRAYTYLMCTMEDANTYPSRILALDVSKYFPVINSSYSAQKNEEAKSEKIKRNSLIFTFALLVLAIAVAFYLGWHRNNAAEERKRADALQKALDQAAIADRVKTVFIQNMRHEIRTPLNAIMGFAQLMSNDLSDEERSLYNGYIQESNNQLLSTLDDIIDVSNMEVGTFNFQFTEIDIDKLCNEKMEETRELLSSGVEFIYQPLPAGLKLFSDYRRIGQVLHNLLSNACKNTSSGEITLSATHLRLNDSIQFVVTDTGIGIPPDKTDVIFEHFEKLDHYSPGLGLGLYVCRLIARALGGDIHLDTHYTNGARFVFTVPNHIGIEENTKADSSTTLLEKARRKATEEVKGKVESEK